MIEDKELEEQYNFKISSNSSITSNIQEGFKKNQEEAEDSQSSSSSLKVLNPNQSPSQLLNQASQNMATTSRYYSDLRDNKIEKEEKKDYNSYVEIDDDSYRERGDNMQVDTFLKELKEDMRERENRNEKRFSELASYTEKRDNQLREELKAREERFRQEAKEREDRFIKSVDELKNEFKETMADNKSTKNAILALSISTILGIAAMVVAIIIAM